MIPAPKIPPVSLASLVEARAKMTPGEWWLDHDGEVAAGGRTEDGHGAVAVGPCDFGSADESGMLATHNAADVLIEVARAAKAWLDSDDEDRPDEIDALIAAAARVTL